MEEGARSPYRLSYPFRLLRSIENRAHLAIVEEWDSIEAHQKAATTIPPDQLEKAKALVAKSPVGEYVQ